MTKERLGNDRRTGQWFWRRLLIFACATFCMTLLVYLVWYGNQSGELDRLIAQGCFWLLGGLVFFYVTGATAQDVIAGARAVRGMPDREYRQEPSFERPTMGQV